MNAPVRPALPPMPKRIARLPLDRRGFPVPWFAAWYKDGAESDRDTGEPDFRVIGRGKVVAAYRRRLCWVCGEPLGVRMAFLIGPMCAINRTTAEPPSHFECATWSAKACPFLTRPRMRRNEKDLPETRIDPAGVHLDRNPGAVCVWVTRSYRPFRVGDGNLFEIGDPETVDWFAEARVATRGEVLASIEGGLPTLKEVAALEGAPALAALDRQIARAMPFLPAEAA